MRTVVIAKLVVLNEAGEVMLLKRTASAQFRPGDWDLPGGHVNHGEAPAAAVCRELAEETGLEVNPDDCQLFYCHTMMVAEDTSAVRLIYWMRLSSQPNIKLSTEHETFQWTPATEIPKVFPHPVFGESVQFATQHRLFEPKFAVPTELIAKTVVIRSNGDVLLLRRSADDDSRPGQWDFPGGGVEDGEDYAVSAARETAEEAGITLDSSELQLFYVHTQIKPHINQLRLLFFARVDNPEVKLSDEHDEFRWVPAEQVSTEFKHPVWGPATDYGLEHGLLKS